jgi:regulator of protease activity HflC (stomatin/prohibitin superfamily)
MISIPFIVLTIVACSILERILLGVARILGFYAIIREREAKVYVLFGEIIGTIDEPGFHFLWPILGWKALFVNWLGRCYTRSLSLDQEYIRSIPVNSEEGTPMGIGVWYEMFISDPVAHIFKNVDPQGSLTANVKNATIKSLSNLPLSEMLINRHEMSRVVRKEVSDESSEWGYKLGSVYIRKVHFRDELMTRQIQEKVVNQLRQVTSAIEQDGLNQVNIIASKAEQEASIEFAKAAAVRPQVVGGVLNTISSNPEVLSTMFEILEYQRMTEGQNELTLVPEGSANGILTPIMAAERK